MSLCSLPAYDQFWLWACILKRLPARYEQYLIHPMNATKTSKSEVYVRKNDMEAKLNNLPIARYLVDGKQMDHYRVIPGGKVLFHPPRK